MPSLINKKLTLIVGGLLAAVLVLLGIIFWPGPANHHLEVVFLDVGQGDSILIKTPYGQKILIDGGPDNKVIKKLGSNLSFFDRDIDLVILTHPHADHVTGLVEVLKRYKVKKIMATGVLHDTPEYLAWLREIEKQKIPFEIVAGKQKIALGDNLRMEIFYPLESLVNKKVAAGDAPLALGKKLNNTSIVSKLIYGQTAFLFTGDIEEEVEQELIKAGVDLKADVLKVAHHGSDSSTSEEFLKAVMPWIAVIEAGKNNQFNLPDYRIVKRLENKGVHVYRTDENGDIKIISDGEKVEVMDNKK
jgi:competence protein ComEC